MQTETIVLAVIAIVGPILFQELWQWSKPRAAKVVTAAIPPVRKLILFSLPFIIPLLYLVASMLCVAAFVDFPAKHADEPVTHESVRDQIVFAAAAFLNGLAAITGVLSIAVRRGRK